MTVGAALHEAFVASARRTPGAVAVVEPGRGTITYGELDALSDRVRDRLAALGVDRGDRIGIYLRKSIDSVATLLGALKAGAAYVPVDPGAPATRGAYILHNCGVKVVVVEAAMADKLGAELAEPGGRAGDDRGRRSSGRRRGPARGARRGRRGGQGAARRHRAKQALRPRLYPLHVGLDRQAEGRDAVARKCGELRRLVLGVFRTNGRRPLFVARAVSLRPVDPRHSRLPQARRDAGADRRRHRQGCAATGALIADERISIWYSAPSILALLAQFGSLATHDYSALRQVLFAGEVFPVKHLRALCDCSGPQPRYFNLYGPTETNVCTYYEVRAAGSAGAQHALPDRQRLLASARPRGRRARCRRGRMAAEASSASPAPASCRDTGRCPSRRQRDFSSPRTEPAGTGPATSSPKTQDGCYTYRGRRDRMVKRRGYRVELGEIEAGLYRHSNIKEAAVVAFADEQGGVEHRGVLELPRGETAVADRDQALLRGASAPVHDSGPVRLARKPAQDVDRQDRLPAPERDALMAPREMR